MGTGTGTGTQPLGLTRDLALHTPAAGGPPALRAPRAAPHPSLPCRPPSWALLCGSEHSPALPSLHRSPPSIALYGSFKAAAATRAAAAF